MSIDERIQRLQETIRSLEKTHQRTSEVTVVAVSKTHSASAIREAFTAGLRHFGESYWQEAQAKQALLRDLPVCWHFIGPIQSNKAADIAHHFSWVHSLSREKTAHLLHVHRPSDLPPLNVCLQVNLDDESTKSGLREEDVLTMAQSLEHFPRLRLRGLMMIPPLRNNHTEQLQVFMRLTTLFHQLNRTLTTPLDTLSMGMSADMAAAIEAGSNMVRIGQAIFGERQ